LFGGIDPANDLAGATDALAGADLVIAATTHLTESLREVAHVVLPVGTFAESAGTFVNVEGRWQSWNGAASAVGESRPGWKVLRVLANLLNIRGTDYMSAEEIREALKKLCGSRLVPAPNVVGINGAATGGAATDGAAAGGAGAGGASTGGGAPSGPWLDIPPYQIDVLVRGSESLAKTKDGQAVRAVL
jgi:NADH-quinone oxidoreductase subunit G